MNWVPLTGTAEAAVQAEPNPVSLYGRFRHDGERPSRMARRRSGPTLLIKCSPSARAVWIGRKSLSSDRLPCRSRTSGLDVAAPRRFKSRKSLRCARDPFRKRERRGQRLRYRRRHADPGSAPARRSAVEHGRLRQPIQCGCLQSALVARSLAETHSALGRPEAVPGSNAIAVRRLQPTQRRIAQRAVPPPSGR